MRDRRYEISSNRGASHGLKGSDNNEFNLMETQEYDELPDSLFGRVILVKVVIVTADHHNDNFLTDECRN